MGYNVTGASGSGKSRWYSDTFSEFVREDSRDEAHPSIAEVKRLIALVGSDENFEAGTVTARGLNRFPDFEARV